MVIEGSQSSRRFSMVPVVLVGSQCFSVLLVGFHRVSVFS